jgi:hypothetical protein
VDQFLFGIVCKALVACGPPAVAPPLPSANPNVIVYQQVGHPVLTTLSIDEVSKIGLDCGQKDRTIQILETKISSINGDPEQLSGDQRKLNSVARSKIWQLRTYCQ